MKSRKAAIKDLCQVGEKEKGHGDHGLFPIMAGSTGLEPAASGVTGRRYNQLNYDPANN